MWMILKQKISDKLFVCNTKIANKFDAKINTTITIEISKIKHEINADLIEINDKSIAEISKIKNEIKAYDNVEMNKILASLNTITSKISEIKKILE